MKRRSLPESEHNDLLDIDTDWPQNRNPANAHLRDVYGLDTEATPEGEMLLIADSDERFLDDISIDTVLHFLFYKKYQDAYNVFFHLHYDAMMILKLLGARLNRYLQTLTLEFEHGEYRIKYIPNKCLSIMKGHHSVSFYDIAQFYASSLLHAYERYIAYAPDWYKELKNRRDQFSHRFYRRNTTLLRRYCIQDCSMTKALGENWLSLYHNAAGFYPQRLISGAYLVCKAMVNRGVAFPRFSETPYSVQSLAYKATLGPRIEMLKRGFIGDGWNYDINSAYPAKIAALPDVRDGEWLSGLTEVEPKAQLGVFKIKANIPEWKYVAPFPFKVRGMLMFPTGRFVTYATIEELRACESKGYYDIIDSWQFIANGGSNYNCPYADFITDLYARKSELKRNDDPLYLPVKIMLNSIYGKTGEVLSRRGHKKLGTFFNPTIFSHILGSARAQLYGFIIERGIERDVVYLHTDAVCTTRDLKIDSDRLGEFSFKGHANDIFCVQNGINRFNGEWKERGIGNLQGRRIENTKIYEESGRVFMKLKIERVKNIKSAIRENKISEIGKFRTTTREVNLNADAKRLWFGRLESLANNQFNDSVPLSMNYFGRV